MQKRVCFCSNSPHRKRAHSTTHNCSLWIATCERVVFGLCSSLWPPCCVVDVDGDVVVSYAFLLPTAQTVWLDKARETLCSLSVCLAGWRKPLSFCSEHKLSKSSYYSFARQLASASTYNSASASGLTAMREAKQATVDFQRKARLSRRHRQTNKTHQSNTKSGPNLASSETAAVKLATQKSVCICMRRRSIGWLFGRSVVRQMRI